VPRQRIPPSTTSPVVVGLPVSTVRAPVESCPAAPVGVEALGQAEGVPGQQLPLRHSPVLAGYGPPVVETSSADGWLEWTEVEHFADSGPQDRHFTLDAVCGLVLFGPAVREADGSLRCHGAVPEKGAEVRIRGYGTGGGGRGNVPAGSICRLKSSVPSVAAVENRRPAVGGVDGETLDEAKSRGPLLVRTRSRAVTAEDYEILAREAAPEIARVRCVPTGRDPAEAGGVRVLIVPAAAAQDGRIPFANLVPPEPRLGRIAAPTTGGVTLWAWVRLASLLSRQRVTSSSVPLR